MSYRLSILDKSPIGEGETAATALSRTLRLAQLAEEWGTIVSGSRNTIIRHSWPVHRRSW